MFSVVGGGSLGFKFGRVTERAGARAAPSDATRGSRAFRRNSPETRILASTAISHPTDQLEEICSLVYVGI